MDSIVEALVEAGYFRARISTLSDFDKIIGGLAWTLQVFSYDININIFYTDSLDLGQKIALTERLVMVILVMNCPHQIEPHQIVGLDYANLLPVIRWLINRSAEVRREHEAFNRLLALRHFHRVTNSSADRSRWCHVVPIRHMLQIENLSKIKNNVGSDDTITALPVQLSMNTNEELKNRDESAMKATSLLIERLNNEFRGNKQFSFVKLPSLFRVSNRDGRSSQFGRDADDENFDEDGSLSSDGAIGVIEVKTAAEANDELTQELDSQDPTNDGPTLADVTYSEESSTLVVNTEALTVQDKEPSSTLSLGEQDEQIELHKELDTELLATNQKILNLLRKFDSIPGKLEIEQYQRRYIELHQQLISTNKDVKKLYTLFNSLDSTKHYLTKEINLLDSILVNLDLTNNSAANRDLFLKQFREIISKIQNVRDDVVSKLDVIRKKCDSLNAEYINLLN